MADDLDKKIKQIADMFGVSDTKSLKNIVDNIASSNSSQNHEDDSSEFNSSHSDNTGISNYSAPPHNNRISAVDFWSKANEMMNLFNNINDSRISLLYSIQPFLRPQRRQRLENAVQLLKIITVISSLSQNNRNNTKG